jgi:hypothetical protein
MLISAVLLISTTAMRAATDPRTAGLESSGRRPAGAAMVVDGGTRSSWFADLSCTLASLGVAVGADIGAAPLTSEGRGAVYARRGDLWSTMLTIL